MSLTTDSRPTQQTMQTRQAGGIRSQRDTAHRAPRSPQTGLLLKRPLPLRVWLILAVVAITGSGFLVQLGMTALIGIVEQQAIETRLTTIRQTIGDDATYWNDPTWQRNANATFASMQVEVALFTGQSNAPAFATEGARRLLDTSTPGDTQADVGMNDDSLTFHQNVDGPSFQRLSLVANAQLGAGTRQIGVAFLWFTGPPISSFWTILWPITELGAFVLALTIVVALIGQPVIRPLIALGEAAEGIAGGNLNVRLPRSPVHEIAEVTSALEGMRSTLRDSLARQDEMERERKFFIGAVAHDLRTPLFMLRGYLQGLQRGIAESPERMAHYLEMCQTKAADLEKLIADLFAFTRLEYLEIEPERQPLELGTLLRQVVEGAQPLAASRQITLTLEEGPTPACLLGDSHLLARAVENLIDNAVCYTQAGGEVHVSWRTDGKQLLFRVADTGPGIAAHDLKHIFEPLYRGEDSRSRQTGGAGIGLAIAHRILLAHGGGLAAANAPTGGAVFAGTLPRLAAK